MGSGHSHGIVPILPPKLFKGISDGRNITTKYGDGINQMNATYDMNKLLRDNGYSPEGYLFDANQKAYENDLIGKQTYNKNKIINILGNKAKHVW